MESGETDIPASSSEQSWIGSLTPLGAAISPFLAGYAADRWGRKTTLLATACPVIVVLGSDSLRRACEVDTSHICGEDHTRLDKVRGALGSLLQIFVSLGSLSQYVVGPYVSYLVLTIFSAMVPFLFAVTMWFVPESPYQHVMAGEDQRALEALQWLRGTSIEAVEEELAIIKENVREKMENKSTPRDLISTKASITSLYLSMGLVGLQILTGIDAILFYSQDIFAATGGDMDSSVSSILIGAVMLLASACTPFFASIGTFFHLHENNQDTSSIGWLPVVSLMVYMIVFSIGFGPVPWAVMGELFAPNVKSMASSIATSFCWFLAFLVTKFFPTISEELGSDYAFWIFGIFAVVAFVSVFFLLPETKGKSLQEIQAILG
uniref:Major facilitator superfamily (MFS) profile domain-containing protein n=1 Tax=Timema bartmani TaxID=61472 RepID=A0A7R9F8J2_9NEOP|nr:unnamed protein product [Timema bartmani]